MKTVLYSDLVATPPSLDPKDPPDGLGRSLRSTPLLTTNAHLRGVVASTEGVWVDWWGLVCEIFLALGVMPLESRVYTFSFGNERWVLTFNNTSTVYNGLEVMHCDIFDRCLFRTPLVCSPCETTFCLDDYDYSELKAALETALKRVLEEVQDG